MESFWSRRRRRPRSVVPMQQPIQKLPQPVVPSASFRNFLTSRPRSASLFLFFAGRSLMRCVNGVKMFAQRFIVQSASVIETRQECCSTAPAILVFIWILKNKYVCSSSLAVRIHVVAWQQDASIGDDHFYHVCLCKRRDWFLEETVFQSLGANNLKNFLNGFLNTTICFSSLTIFSNVDQNFISLCIKNNKCTNKT